MGDVMNGISIVVDSSNYLGIVICLTLLAFIFIMRAFDDKLRNLFIVNTLAILLGLLFEITYIGFDSAFNNPQIRTFLSAFRYVCGIAAVFTTTFIVYNYYSKTNKRNLLALSFVTAIVVLGAILQLAEVFKSCLLPSMAIGLMFFYLYMYAERYNIDSVSKCYKRRCFYSDANKYAKYDIAIVSMDLNDLKKINDNYGHKAGDVALLTFAEVCRSVKSRKFILYRTGGDEFMLLGIKATKEEAEDLVKQVKIKLMETPYTCSFGIHMYKPADDFDDAVVQADKAMYDDKKAYKQIHSIHKNPTFDEDYDTYTFTNNISFLE